MNEIESVIRASVETVCASGVGIRVTHGWGITRGEDGVWVTKNGQCCPLGAVILTFQPDGKDEVTEAAKLLGVSSRWIIDFFTAFDDGLAFTSTYRNAEALGKRMRAECLV